MVSPPDPINVQCPKCNHSFEADIVIPRRLTAHEILAKWNEELRRWAGIEEEGPTSPFPDSGQEPSK